MVNNISYRTDERLQFDEYADFLTRTDLGNQYPAEDFMTRMPMLLKNYSVGITARNEDGLLVGACLGVTDFAYYLFVIDIGVARDYVSHGIGSQLLRLAHETAGGEDKICMVLDSASCSRGFYEKFGFEHWQTLVVYDKEPWTEMELTPEKLAELKKNAK
ncbi:MAG: GNAT family N-acetyltransferase [Anaerolineae bacterium]|jgi:GNAT superfamily N-acetyltransferase|nr:GNAT family N-acetyltransferase [Anaerolineae bacterium]